MQVAAHSQDRTYSNGDGRRVACNDLHFDRRARIAVGEAVDKRECVVADSERRRDANHWCIRQRDSLQGEPFDMHDQVYVAPGTPSGSIDS